MTHDPLCRFHGKRAADDEYDDCEYCDLIAKVRADQDRRNAARQLTRDAQDMGMIP